MNAYLTASRGEVLKVVTTRLWWVLAIVVVAYLAPTTAALASVFGIGTGEGLDPEMLGIDPAEFVYTTATSVGYVFPLLYGSLAVSGELRHQTITPTFLATPRRPISLGAKVSVQAGVGVFYGLLAFTTSLLTGGLMLMAFDADPGLTDSSTWFIVLRGLVAMALWAVIGVGAGALLRNQVAAIIVVLAFTQFIEPILRTVSLLADWSAAIGKFLPSAASDALVGGSMFSIMGMGGADTLSTWQGGLVLAGYGALFTVVGYFVTYRRDIT